MKEIWIPIKWNGVQLYASNIGQIKDSAGRIKHQNESFKYNRISVKGKKELVHRIIATAFIPNPNNLETVNHIDGNKKNNSVKNLEWCSSQENSLKSSKNIELYSIEQRSANGNLISVFSSQREAAKATGIHHEAINMCCKGKRKTAGGFFLELCRLNRATLTCYRVTAFLVCFIK